MDVDGIARFALGRFWRQATEDERRAYMRLFPEVLIIQIAAALGSYAPMRFTIDRAVRSGGRVEVWTTVFRLGGAPRQVEWVVEDSAGVLKVTDILAEGASMRIAERDDCATFLATNNYRIPALIEMLRRKAAAG
jgi:phospholipid transport system substrate-binding protein